MMADDVVKRVEQLNNSKIKEVPTLLARPWA